ncbi:MAG: diguanylate cyclase [Gammaproteobacteria bacterium]|nr:diguanylate cyclase [Gammaproteobacteria bacterium]
MNRLLSLGRLMALVVLMGLTLVGSLGAIAYYRLQQATERNAMTVGAIALRFSGALYDAIRKNHGQVLRQLATDPSLERFVADRQQRHLAPLLTRWRQAMLNSGLVRRLALVDGDGRLLVDGHYDPQRMPLQVALGKESYPDCLPWLKQIDGLNLGLYIAQPRPLTEPDSDERLAELRWPMVARVTTGDGEPLFVVAELSYRSLMSEMWLGSLLGRVWLTVGEGPALIGFDNSGTFWPQQMDDHSRVILALQQPLPRGDNDGLPVHLHWQLTVDQRWQLMRQQLVEYLWPVLLLAGVVVLLSPLLALWWHGRAQRWREAALGRAALESMAALVITDSQWQVMEVNAAFSRITGFAAKEVVDQPFANLLAEPEQLQLVTEGLKRSGKWRGELACKRANGDSYAQLSEFNQLVVAGRQRHIIGNFLDLTEQKLLERQLRELSHKDPLTGIWNRRKLNEVVDQEIARQERHHQPFALAIIDLDHFKQINDRYGHDRGDDVLRHAVEVFAAGLRRSDLLARVGGEEFVAFLPHTEQHGAEVVLERLREGLAHSASDPQVTCSIGLACYHPGDSRKTLQRRADEALYLAKSRGRNRLVMADAG